MFFRENVFMVEIEGYHTLIFFSIGISLLIVFTHRANIKRLIAGTENRMSAARLLGRKGNAARAV
jgi:glycerol-3-phosphate acyltransferase PlsY